MVEKVGAIEYTVTLDSGRMIQGSKQVNKELNGMGQAGTALTAKLSQVTLAIGSLSSALYVIAKADAFTKMNAQLSLATNSTRELGIAQAETKKIAQEAQADLLSVAQLYAKVSSSTADLGISQKTVGEITRATSLALKVSGASAAESSSAIMQLGQAFASGVLRGDEFNSIAEAAPRLMKALADGIGVPIGALREMAAQGQLTSEVLATALPKALKDLEGEAQQIQTISGAFQQLNNEIMLFIGQQTTSSGAAKLTSDAIGALAQNIDLLAAAALGFAAAKLAGVLLEIGNKTATNTISLVENIAAQRAAIAATQAATAATVAETSAKLAQLTASNSALVISRAELAAKLAATNQTLAQAAAQLAAAKSAGAMSFALALVREAEMTTAAAQAARLVVMKQMAVLGAQQASVTAALTAATTAHTAAQTANTAAMGASGVASTLASRALAAVGGPIGLITTLLGLGVTAWALWGTSAKDESKNAADEVEASGREIIASLDRQNAKLRERLALAKAGNVDAAKSGSKDAERLASTLAEINALKAKGAALTGSDQIQLAELEGRYRDISGALAENKRLKGEIEEAGQQSKASEWAKKYATDIERVNEEIAKAKKELGSAFTPELEQRIRANIIPEKKTQKTQKTPDQKFDDAGYLAGLRKQTVSDLEKINVEEAELIRKNEKLLTDKKINRQTYEEGLSLIVRGAALDRKAISDKELKDAQDLEMDAAAFFEDQLAAYEEREKRRANARTNAKIDTLQIRANNGGLQDQENLVNAVGAADMGEAETKRVEAARILDLEAMQIYADQKVAIEEDMNARIQELRDNANQSALSSTSEMFGSLASIMKNAAGEQSGAYQVMFAAQKAASIAQSIVAIQTGIAQASALPFPMNLGAMATVAANTAGIVATISGTNIQGRQYGGPVSSGSLYRVNETGAPEMYTANNGNQYMMPTKSGKVTAADKLGGNITIINNTSANIGQVTQERKPNGDMAIYIHEAVAAVNAAMSDPNSGTSRAMGRNFSLQRSR